ncbi:MBL fold metallo-hydrolase, partial [candidate division WOR-3 bacterium]|nr:MBL fold metallo-hydrolase [candidate division WOR-3 bacterium]
EPWMVFTGDALFAGDAGRTDLLGMDRARELAGALYESIFGRILPLGDGVLLWPAHGAGSACGAGIASRERTTLGLERRLNPKLRLADREEFIDAAAKELPRPPYFREMERVNLVGGPAAELPVLEPLAPDEFAGWLADAQVLDARPAAAFAAAHVPGALSAWPDGVASFAGWFLDFDRPVALVAGAGQERIIQRRLARLGFERLVGFLAGGIVAWLTAGRAAAATRTVTVGRLCEELDEGGDAVILDVRGREEAAAAGEIPGARLVPLTELADRLDELDREEELTVFCGTGLRSMIAASLLEQRVFRRVRVALGGLRGWRSRSCPVKLASD